MARGIFLERQSQSDAPLSVLERLSQHDMLSQAHVVHVTSEITVKHGSPHTSGNSKGGMGVCSPQSGTDRLEEMTISVFHYVQPAHL